MINMKPDETETINLIKCMKEQNLDLNFYLHRLRHILQTFEDEKEHFPVLNFEEDLEHVLDLIRICTPKGNTTNKRYYYLVRRLKRDRYK